MSDVRGRSGLHWGGDGTNGIKWIKCPNPACGCHNVVSVKTDAVALARRYIDGDIDLEALDDALSALSFNGGLATDLDFTINFLVNEMLAGGYHDSAPCGPSRLASEDQLPMRLDTLIRYFE